MKDGNRETIYKANKQKDALVCDGWEDQASSSQYFSFLFLHSSYTFASRFFFFFFFLECNNASLLWLIWYRDGRQTPAKVSC
jgi:hypothetical protein